MKKTLIILLPVVVLAFFLISGQKAEALGEKTTTEKARSETPEAGGKNAPTVKITLRFLDFWTEMEDVMLESIAKFQEKNPYVEIVRDTCPWDQAETVLKTNIAGGTPYDIATYWPMYMKTFVNQDAALDLTENINSDPEWKSGIEGLLDLGVIDGRVYAVPFKSIYVVTYYNRDLFREYGLSEPSTLQEFEEVMKTIKRKGKVAPFCNYGAAICWLPRFMMPALADRAGVLEEFITGKIDASDPSYRDIYKKPYEIILNWYKNGYLYGGEGAAGISRDEAKVAFSRGEVAMINETTSEYGGIKEISNFEIGIFKFPSVVDPPKYYFLSPSQNS